MAVEHDLAMLLKIPRWHHAIVLPDASNKLRKIRNRFLNRNSRRLAPRWPTGASSAVAYRTFRLAEETARPARLSLICLLRQWLDRTTIMPLCNRGSTVHGVVFSVLLAGLRRGPSRRRGRSRLRRREWHHCRANQSATAIASISISHSGAASAETPTSVDAGGSMPSKKAERAFPMIGRSSGL